MNIDTLNKLLNKEILDENYDEVERLIEEGADVNNIDYAEFTPLIDVALEGHNDLVKLLIKAGANVNYSIEYGNIYDKLTPLHAAVDGGNSETVRILIEAGADVNAVDSDNMTPLYIAARKGSIEKVNLLINADADVDIADIEGETPLYVASRRGYDIVVKALIKAGADVYIKNTRGKNALNRATNERVKKLLKAAKTKKELEELNLIMKGKKGTSGLVEDTIASFLKGENKDKKPSRGPSNHLKGVIEALRHKTPKRGGARMTRRKK
jgi:ankyrin repeat protein